MTGYILQFLVDAYHIAHAELTPIYIIITCQTEEEKTTDRIGDKRCYVHEKMKSLNEN